MRKLTTILLVVLYYFTGIASINSDPIVFSSRTDGKSIIFYSRADNKPVIFHDDGEYFFDDFDDDNFDTDKWVIIWGDAGNVHEQNQRLEINIVADALDVCIQTKTFTQARPFKIEYDIYSSAGTSNQWVFGFLYTGSLITSQYRLYYSENNGYILYKDHVAHADGWIAGDLARLTWYAVKIEVTATNILLYIISPNNSSSTCRL